MHTITPAAVTDVLDYAGHFFPLEEDSLICIALTPQGAPGACARSTPTSPNTPAQDIAGTALSTLRQASIHHVLALFTGREAEPARARRVLRLLRRGVEVTTALCLQGFTWHEMNTHTAGAYIPGTSNTGLLTAIDHGALTADPALPTPAPHSTLTTATSTILTHWRHLTTGQTQTLTSTAHATLLQRWPRMLATEPDDTDATQALLDLNTPQVLTHTLTLSTLHPAAGGPNTTHQDLLTGMPHGVDWATSQATDTLLTALITRGPDHAAIGPLTALAYSSWLRGRGSRAHALLDAADALAVRHEHLPLRAQVLQVREIIGGRIAASALSPVLGSRS